MTLAEITTVPENGMYPQTIECPNHGIIQKAPTYVHALAIARIHDEAFHPRALNRKLNKKR